MLAEADILWDLPAPEDLPHLGQLKWIQTTSTGVGASVAELGLVERDVLVKLIKQDFELAINIEEMIAQVDEDGSGEIEFGEFCELLAGSES